MSGQECTRARPTDLDNTSDNSWLVILQMLKTSKSIFIQ